MKKLITATLLIILIALTGCSSGGSVILDKAAITKANNAINDLAKIVGSYKRLNDGKLPPEGAPLFESLKGFLTDVKREQFMPSYENTYRKMVGELIDQKGGVSFTNEEYGAMFASLIAQDEKIDMTAEEISTKITAYLNEAEVPDITESEIYEAVNNFDKKIRNEVLNYGEITNIVTTERIEKGMNELLTADDLDGLEKDARKLYRSTLPPFNTDPQKGGWAQPKWLVVEPDVNVVYEQRVQEYVEKFNRQPSRAMRRTIMSEAETYSANSKVGYVVWVANDSNNTLVYAKVN